MQPMVQDNSNTVVGVAQRRTHHTDTRSCTVIIMWSRTQV
jgi:hypothetical protein